MMFELCARLKRKDRALLRELLEQNRTLLAELGRLVERVEKAMSVVDLIEAEVRANTSVVQSVAVLVQGLTSQLQTVTDELKASGADTTRLQAVLDTMKANDAVLGELVAANTAAAPAPAEPAPADPVAAPIADDPNTPVV